MAGNVMPFTLDCADKGPETLLDLCFKYVVQHLETIGTAHPITKDFVLHKDIVIPTEICEKLLQGFQRESGLVLDDRVLNIFNDTQTTRLQKVRLRNAKITDYGLRTIMRHKLSELEITHCPKLTDRSLEFINENSCNLVSLVVGSTARIMPQSLVADDPLMEDLDSIYLRRGHILNAPRLRRLALRHHRVPRVRSFFPTLLRPLRNLTHLDLSGCEDLGNLSYLLDLKALVSLVLHNVDQIQEAVPTLCWLTTLRHLDISQLSEANGTFADENSTLSKLVESLPELTSLDISGTNLAGTGVAGPSDLPAPKTDIPGLSSRVGRPLDFLGLYGTMHAACRRHDIPARMVSGDCNEAQILVAAAAYIDRPEVLQKVLNELYHLFRYETCQNMNQALGTVLEAMNRHIHEKHIQISGSATLFYIVKGKESRHVFGPRMKCSIIGSLLNGMAAHKDDDTMLRNGCLTLCQFKIPEDVLFDYRRLVHILLYIVSEMEQEGFVQRIGIYLLNSLACQVDGFQKQLLGDLGAIERMLALIEDRLERGICDDVLEVAWSTMWNVTDETAINCLRFLDGKGMEFFLACLRTFPDKEELLRNMMGLLGNVAEVQTLRCRLMTSQFVSVFSDLLESCSDGIEVSYNAAGVLAHMASDGAAAWTLAFPRREDVLSRMVSAIERWDLATERNINYRSFEPILHLAQVYHSPECQHWAIWALANLTKVYPAKYCSLVEAEGGLVVLQEIISHPLPYPKIKELATMVRDNCQRHQANQWPENLHQMLTLDG